MSNVFLQEKTKRCRELLLTVFLFAIIGYAHAQVKVLAWNVADGTKNSKTMPELLKYIDGKSGKTKPDVIMLSEAGKWVTNGVDPLIRDRSKVSNRSLDGGSDNFIYEITIYESDQKKKELYKGVLHRSANQKPGQTNLKSSLVLAKASDYKGYKTVVEERVNVSGSRDVRIPLIEVANANLSGSTERILAGAFYFPTGNIASTAGDKVAAVVNKVITASGSKKFILAGDINTDLNANRNYYSQLQANGSFVVFPNIKNVSGTGGQSIPVFEASRDSNKSLDYGFTNFAYGNKFKSTKITSGGSRVSDHNLIEMELTTSNSPTVRTRIVARKLKVSASGISKKTIKKTSKSFVIDIPVNTDVARRRAAANNNDVIVYSMFDLPSGNSVNSYIKRNEIIPRDPIMLYPDVSRKDGTGTYLGDYNYTANELVGRGVETKSGKVANTSYVEVPARFRGACDGDGKCKGTPAQENIMIHQGSNLNGLEVKLTANTDLNKVRLYDDFCDGRQTSIKAANNLGSLSIVPCIRKNKITGQFTHDFRGVPVVVLNDIKSYEVDDIFPDIDNLDVSLTAEWDAAAKEMTYIYSGEDDLAGENAEEIIKELAKVSATTFSYVVSETTDVVKTKIIPLIEDIGDIAVLATGARAEEKEYTHHALAIFGLLNNSMTSIDVISRDSDFFVEAYDENNPSNSSTPLFSMDDDDTPLANAKVKKVSSLRFVEKDENSAILKLNEFRWAKDYNLSGITSPEVVNQPNGQSYVPFNNNPYLEYWIEVPESNEYAMLFYLSTTFPAKGRINMFVDGKPEGWVQLTLAKDKFIPLVDQNIYLKKGLNKIRFTQDNLIRPEKVRIKGFEIRKKTFLNVFKRATLSSSFTNLDYDVIEKDKIKNAPSKLFDDLSGGIPVWKANHRAMNYMGLPPNKTYSVKLYYSLTSEDSGVRINDQEFILPVTGNETYKSIIVNFRTSSPYRGMFINTLGRPLIRLAGYEISEPQQDIFSLMLRNDKLKKPKMPGFIKADFFDDGGQDIAYYDTTTKNTYGDARITESVDVRGSGDLNKNDVLGKYSGSYVAVVDIEGGEWLEYTIDNVIPGNYDFGFRVYNKRNRNLPKIKVLLDGENLGAVTIPYMGTTSSEGTSSARGANVWKKMRIPTGNKKRVLRIEFQGDLEMYNFVSIGSDLNVLQHTYYDDFKIPGVIRTEYYDFGGEGVSYSDNDYINDTETPGTMGRTNTGVDVTFVDDPGSDIPGNGRKITSIKNGEWVEYTQKNVTSGTYDIIYRVKTSNTNGAIKMILDGNNLGRHSFPNTRNQWANAKIRNVTINTSGRNKVLRLEMIGGGFELNHVEFIKKGSRSKASLTANEQQKLESYVIESGDILIYPNPANNKLNIEYPVRELGWYTIDVYSLDGKQIIHNDNIIVEEKNNEITSIDVSKLVNGLYILKISTPHGQIISKLIEKE